MENIILGFFLGLFTTVDGRAQQEMGEPRSGHGAVFCVLQLLPRSHDATENAGHGSRVDGRGMEPGSAT
jgi:hypothetical protein